MDHLIDELFGIIGDYRINEEGAISKDIITTWINQFDENDREFLLKELCFILEKRYITRNDFKDYLKNTFFNDILSALKDKYGITHVKEAFVKSYFIDHQPEGKSQKEIIKLFEEVINEELGLTLADCGNQEPLCFIYLDDVLCTGDTLFKGLSSWLEKVELDDSLTNQKILEKGGKPLMCVFYAVHTLNMHKVRKRLEHAHKPFNVETWYFFDDDHQIDNDYGNIHSKLQFIFPKSDVDNEEVESCKQHIEKTVDDYCEAKGYKKNKSVFYRADGTPKTETLFSNSENRDRFEKIILNKSIELYEASKTTSIRMRPLGNGLITDKSFGFGTLFFSWRNVPFNTPIVFWYEHKGWTPLFKRKWSSYENSLEDWLKDLFG